MAEISSFGPRPSGSQACEKFSREYILAELEELRRQTTRNLQIDTQLASGCFDIDFISRDYTQCYRRVTNIVAKLGPKNNKTDKNPTNSLLLNCHFDSVPGSPGNLTNK